MASPHQNATAKPRRTPPRLDDDDTCWSEVFRVETKSDTEGGLFDDPTDDPEAYVQHIETRLYVDETPVAQLHSVAVRGNMIVNDGLDLAETMADVSEDLSVLANAVVARNGYKDRFYDRVMPMGLEMLYLSHLVVEERFRGHEFGLALIQHALRFQEHDVAFLVPFPLQHGRRTGPFPSELRAFEHVPEKQGVDKLRRHYGKLGFERLSRTKVMYRDNGVVHPYRFPEPDDATKHALRALVAKRKPVGVN